MSILLPAKPAPKEFVPRLISTGGLVSTATESDEFYIDTPGDRWEADFVMRPMAYEQASEWAALETKNDSVVMSIPQPGLDTCPASSPRVNGAGQAGNEIDLDGLYPYQVIRIWQWLSIITNGRRYAYRARGEVIANASGVVTVPLSTILRAPHADNDVVEIADPKIEGRPSVSADAWKVNAADRLIYLSFNIRERG